MNIKEWPGKEFVIFTFREDTPNKWCEPCLAKKIKKLTLDGKGEIYQFSDGVRAVRSIKEGYEGGLEETLNGQYAKFMSFEELCSYFEKLEHTINEDEYNLNDWLG